MSGRYLLRRPRALQFVRVGDSSLTPITSVKQEADSVLLPVSSDESRTNSDDPSPRSVEGTATTLKRQHLDLFIDLIFVGIVGNLSEHFSAVIFTPPAKDQITFTGNEVIFALVEFETLFLLTWRIWNYLRDFTNNFFIDDILQRIFLVWILVLALLIGNTAPYAFANAEGAHMLIALYLVTRGSFLLIEALYCFFIPWLWKETLFAFLLGVPSFALWIAALEVEPNGWTQLGLVFGAMAFDSLAIAVLHSSLMDRLLVRGYRKALNMEHYVERVAAFFVIILGEGVLLLIKGSPLADKIDINAGTGIASLALYFCLHMLYFRGGASAKSLEELRVSKWKLAMWQFFHLVLFSALLLLDVVNLFIVQNVGATRDEPTTIEEAGVGNLRRRLVGRAEEEGGGEETLTPEEIPEFVQKALWIGAASLSIVLFALTGLAVLNKAPNSEKGMWIKSVSVRLAPRVLVVVVICCLPLVKHLAASTWLATAVGLVWATLVWESVLSVKKGGGLIEPKDSRDC